MSRVAREYVKTEYFHIMSQGINREYIFDKEQDKNIFRALMLYYSKKLNINIVAYCIMSNHVHLLINVSKIREMSNYMHRLNFRYAKYYNTEYKRVGYVFRDRFKAEGIYSKEYLTKCIAYIHNNPLEAEICNDLADYKFSSYLDYKMHKNKYFKEIFAANIDYFNSVHGYNEFEYFIGINKNIEELADKYLKDNNVTLEELKDNMYRFRNFLIFLNTDNCISLRKIGEYLKISREKLRKIIK